MQSAVVWISGFVCSDSMMQCVLWYNWLCRGGIGCGVVQWLWWDRVWCGAVVVVCFSAFQWALHLVAVACGVQIGFAFVQLYAVMCICCSVLFWLLQSSTVF